MPLFPDQLLRAVPLVAAAGLWGCGAAPAAVPPQAEVNADRASTPLERLLAADNGLMVLRWVVRDDPTRVQAMVDAYGRPYDGNDAVASALARNGFVLAAVPTGALESAGAELGEHLTDVQVWHGQAPQWREGQHASLGRSDLAVLVDGHARILNGGVLNLLLRSWTVPMEDGAFLQVEFVPQYEPPIAGGYRKLLGTDRLEGDVFRELLVELQLRPDECWILTASGTGSSREAGIGPPAIGPDVLLPPTLGQLLFIDPRTKVRTALVFQAVLPEAATPPAGARPDDEGSPAAEPDADFRPADSPAAPGIDDEPWEQVPLQEPPT
ncbi:MAG: hypothetical protein KDA22_10560 [Phycisphaerales bacterium]|nr:hypothetical protein [Phycisphaerales bacterium]